MSEAVIITTNPLDGDRIAGSVGFPLPGVELRIGGGEATGVIEIRGPSVFSGYWRMPEKTREAFTADGYFITGDVGRVDPDGRLWISGRAKDLIISGGVNVSPAEVEAAISRHPDIVSCAVQGKPDADMGQIVHAVIEMQRKTLSLEELSAFLSNYLVRAKHPRSLTIQASAVRDDAGKFRKQ
jgi:malonyl-CoA/methylmalonyl-CoA synthetase